MFSFVNFEHPQSYSVKIFLIQSQYVHFCFSHWFTQFCKTQRSLYHPRKILTLFCDMLNSEFQKYKLIIISISTSMFKLCTEKTFHKYDNRLTIRDNSHPQNASMIVPFKHCIKKRHLYIDKWQQHTVTAVNIVRLNEFRSTNLTVFSWEFWGINLGKKDTIWRWEWHSARNKP